MIGGRGVTPSADFTLPESGRVQLSVRAGRRAGHVLGWIAAGVGAAGGVGGATTMTLADDRGGVLRSGGIVLGAGAALLIGGAILIATGRTRVRITPQTSPGEPAPAGVATSP